MIADAPDPPVPTPQAVTEFAAGRAIHLVWENELGGVTFEVGGGGDRCFLKWTPVDSGIDLSAETARMRWAAAFTPVPRVLVESADGHGSWIVTTPITGQSAVSERWSVDPAQAVAAIGVGLRALHDTLPVSTCPFSWSAPDRAASARRRVTRLRPERWHPVHRPLSTTQALRIADEPPPVDRLVVCHGDPCAPNTVLTDAGAWSGHVDLGDLGTADRWADLAVATWSTEWNYGPGWQGALLTAYGVAADPPRTAYYRLLWDLDP